ncbi:MAG: site-2 protease family protein [Sulfurospirillaceae bacterium]|jgi:Zn-dependent protease|nr:site-2 protease family protein [Sulfurospirillaceae bacterium]MCK9545816.1 site-2 protease family protein [Sulfurospirillaceae bacterium]MDY0238518.1 site-2 protease family protein [Campylobacterales bacterium]NLM99678.1 site-2 protease family protein [Campylobacteraceae bacterium]
MDLSNPLTIVLIILSVIIAVVGHEIMHGYIAYKNGDLTAKNSGRLSINPIVHIDLVGTIIVPIVLYLSSGFMFGWAKPVPVRMGIVIRNGGYLGAIKVSLAGIAYNFALAFVASIFFHLTKGQNIELYQILNQFFFHLIVINVILGVFNLYPIPPLDGSWALGYLGALLGTGAILNFFEKIRRYGFVLLILIFLTPLSSIIFTPISYIVRLFLH